MKIKSIKAREILDSRGNPTVGVELKTEGGIFIDSVPSGASTGKYEAVELRDGGKRYGGKGVLKAVNNVNKIIAPKLIGEDPTKQKKIDGLMIKLDGTKNKSRLGANAILAVSIAVARAGAKTKKLSLWKWISKIADTKPKIPAPSILHIEGGLHGKGGLRDAQEVMVVSDKKSFKDKFTVSKKIYSNLSKILNKKYGKEGIRLGLEGAFVPSVKSLKEVLPLLIEAAENQGIKIILDIAASHDNCQKSADYYLGLSREYPILGIEDPYTQDNVDNWQELNSQNSKILIIGDDLTVTNPERIKWAHQKKLCNAVIIKPNQIGTVSEAINAVKLAKSYSWKTIVSHRAGETMDDFIADFAVGIGAEFIKSGAPFPKERMTKYNRLLRIEEEIIKII